MPDAYSNIATAETNVLNVLINAMELRAADPQQRVIRERFLSEVGFSVGARVLEAGCGSGAICRELASWPHVGEVVGLDPAPAFLAKARELAAGIPNLRFEEGDARSLAYEDDEFDVVVFHTCLTHVPGPERALAEAFRVLRPGGRLAILDGDYATTTVAIGDHDPLQVCADAAMAGLVHDRWLVRRLPPMVNSAGFRIERFDSYGYLQTSTADYMLTLVDRGADLLVNSGQIDSELAEGLKQEARRRVDDGRFFGFISSHSPASSPAPRPSLIDAPGSCAASHVAERLGPTSRDGGALLLPPGFERVGWVGDTCLLRTRCRVCGRDRLPRRERICGIGPARFSSFVSFDRAPLWTPPGRPEGVGNGLQAQLCRAAHSGRGGAPRRPAAPARAATRRSRRRADSRARPAALSA